MTYKPGELRIYFALSSCGKRLKIGCSLDPKSRIKWFRARKKITLRILCTMPGDFVLEKKLHARFSSLKESAERDEWFRYEGKLKQYVEALLSGQRGGVTKGEMQELRRAAVAHEDVVRRICEAPELSWRRRAQILGPLFSPGTLRRRYT